MFRYKEAIIKRLLLIVLPLLLIVGCEDNETKENYTFNNLPTEYPLDKDYAWQYLREEYSTKTLWENETLPDTSYLDTLFIAQTQNLPFFPNSYCYYWWGNNPGSFSIVKNKNDEEVSNLLDDLIKDHKEQSNLRKIESLEQKLINNLDESSYTELIKLKNQLNRE